eukprot:CAMPEP_0183759842 /NCGR_PEP_ID=MMETSP0739-20130205/7341_1 /TAXON_ID=385413 /ORGANISM="Thalassiosira miniscula, Strain CCMP1093" /LENGTH=386 /DNA_ID=CAMNT_0025997685 /DNA_START=168 /DNA_END=1328 /DNA_ORIENTATION=-
MMTLKNGFNIVALASSSLFLLQQAGHTNAFAYVDQPDGIVPRIPADKTNAKINSAKTTPAPDPNELQKYATFCETLADAARKEIQPYWRQSRHALGQEVKVEENRSVFQSASPVTLADRAAERAMRDLISEHWPEHGIYGEEYGIKDADADWVWVLDPIDGTRSFITGKPLFGTLVSLLYKGTPVIGCIDQCILNERWLGIAGQESTLNGIPIKTDGVETLSDAEMYSTTPDMFQDGHEQLKFDAMRDAVKTAHYGADCYAYALVASGFGADVVLEADLGLYDYCALVPVLEGAGGIITDWTGETLTLGNHESSKGRVVASANSQLHDQALQILNKSTKAGEDILGVPPKSDELLAAVLDSKQSNSNVTPLICGLMLGEVIAHLGP